ncbi:hypothetical protein Y032_0281g1249 [Ancylostoma ceylanicum]|uniref:WAPL domain-containing protein n=1 Tax=Ancylostoma ceylanicum TaxID=53326 RepID=A0A016S6L4_9BILA|nr:hypothetical protein Y032_0281g1249 [Ancylostoma ceylanicum]
MMLTTLAVYMLQSVEADFPPHERKGLQDPFEFDLYEEPASDSDDAFSRMATLCARLQKRAPHSSRDRKAAPLVFRLCDMLN